MAYTKINLLDIACKIAKSYAKSGGPIPPEAVLKNVYEELKKINEDLDK